MGLTRRSFLAAALLAPSFARQLPSGARFVATMPLGNPGAVDDPQFGRLLGSGLDARLYNDLSVLSEDKPETLVTSNERFFVRTAFSSTVERTAPWTVRIGGLGQAPVEVGLRDLEPLVAPAGRYLIECAGNPDRGAYGLMSTADWEGVPLARVLERARATPGAYRVLVSGADDERTPTRTSVPGASWIFSRDDLHDAVLAVRMNGAALPRDHGFPVRLVIPGWYGCACIKWVNRVELVPDEAAATTQMREFAGRTHQDPRAALARDFAPAVIDTAAMPIRIEKWIADGHVVYRVIGILWGGSKPTNALAIRFKARDRWVAVDHCPVPDSTRTWSLWTHTWRPPEPGRYEIVLKVTDPSIRTRRLDLFFYVRETVIDEV